MNSERGFTLIEAMASGILSAVIAGGILSVAFMTRDQVNEGSAYEKLKSVRSAVSEQIRASARIAYGAMKSDEDASTVNTPLGLANPVFANLSEIRFYDRDFFLVKGYRLDTRYLLEGYPVPGAPNTLAYKPFLIGEDTVIIDPVNSRFTILSNRQGITSNLKLKLNVGGVDYVRPSDSEFVLCRN